MLLLLLVGDAGRRLGAGRRLATDDVLEAASAVLQRVAKCISRPILSVVLAPRYTDD